MRRRAGSGAPYTVTYSIPGVTAKNLTGAEGIESARIVITGDPGSGCNSKNPYKQFNTAAFAAPGYGSLGLESGASLLGGCFDRTTDLSIARNIKILGNKQAQLRIDAFNAPNHHTLGNPNTNITSGDFGRITGIGGTRTAQVGAKFNF